MGGSVSTIKRVVKQGISSKKRLISRSLFMPKGVVIRWVGGLCTPNKYSYRLDGYIDLMTCDQAIAVSIKQKESALLANPYTQSSPTFLNQPLSKF